jgi:transcriptional regulator with XRE-family HTH domain
MRQPSLSLRIDKLVIRKDEDMWLDNLKELKKKTGMTSKQIAEKTNLPERTVIRIFSGDTDNPYVDTLRRIVAVLGGSLDDIFAESKTIVGGQDLVAAQAEVDRLTAEVAILTAENAVLKDKVSTLMAESDLLRLKLEHKEEIIAIHNYYNKLKSNN